jgi:hypothetical protein
MAIFKIVSLYAWCHSSQFCSLLLLRQGLENFSLGWPGTTILLVSASCLVEMTGTHHCTWLLVEMGAHRIFVWGWPRTVMLSISDSGVIRITGVSHQCSVNVILILIIRCFPSCKSFTLTQKYLSASFATHQIPVLLPQLNTEIDSQI